MEKLSLFGYWLKCISQNYASFSGRARRSEYWGFALFNTLGLFALSILSVLIGDSPTGILYSLWVLVFLIPNIAVLVRRLHDVGKSGWYTLMIFIPLIGSILLLIWTCTDSELEENQYGPNPKY